MDQPTLTQAQQRRLLKLAREAGRTPQSMLRFVLQDGFGYCDYVVRAVGAGINSIERGERTHSTVDVMRAARSATGRHGARFHKAA